MKKIITILLVSLMVLTLTACNKKQEETVVEEPTVQEVVKQEESKKEETVTVTPEVKEEVTVVEEVTKEDTVDVTTLSYWVNFLNPDGSLISRKAYKYGDTPVYPTNPEFFDGVAYYAFREWDKKLSPVHMTQTYKALYDVTGYVKNESGTPEQKPEKLHATLSMTVIPWDDDDPNNLEVLEFPEIMYEPDWTWAELIENTEGNIEFRVRFFGAEFAYYLGVDEHGYLALIDYISTPYPWCNQYIVVNRDDNFLASNKISTYINDTNPIELKIQEYQ